MLRILTAPHLLHDTSFSLREGNVATRLVLDEFDLNLSAFSSALLIVVIIIIARHRCSWSLRASGINTIASQIIAGGRMVKASVGIGDVRHSWILIGSVESDERSTQKSKVSTSRKGKWVDGRHTSSEVWITEIRLLRAVRVLNRE